MQFLQISFSNNSVQQWLLSLGGTIVALFVLVVIKKIILRKWESAAQKNSKEWNDVVADVFRRTHFLFLGLIAIYFGSLALDLPHKIKNILETLTILAVLFQGAIWAQYFIQFFLDHLVEKRLRHDISQVPIISFIGFSTKFVVWVTTLLVGLDNLGVNVTTLIAGLGVGGVAIALASQKILEDVFASLSIILDKPFVNGDFVTVGEYHGTIEHIGLKTTRMRSLSGEQIIISNSDLLKSRIRNFKKMYERRVVFETRVVYRTSLEMLEKIPVMIKEIVNRQQKARFDRCHFTTYGDFSLIFETVYFVTDADFTVYRDIEEAINLEIFRHFGAEGIEFAHSVLVPSKGNL